MIVVSLVMSACTGSNQNETEAQTTIVDDPVETPVITETVETEIAPDRSAPPEPPEPTPVGPTSPPAPQAPPDRPIPGPDAPMLVGFHDDRTFLYLDTRAASLDQATQLGADVIRTYAVWEQIAPTRPANAADPNDPAYDWSFHDALVRESIARGVQVLMTIWATPDWASAGLGDSSAPAELQDLTDFAFALARRYSGGVDGVPAVELFSFWNEPNLNRFLTPQFDASGASVAPATYAAMYRAAYLGLKAGNPNARVAFLEVSPRGRDRPGERPTRDSHSPGRFAELVAEACAGRCEFDAIAWHPYTPSLSGTPSSKVRWPNANLPELDRFVDALVEWFDLSEPPRLWITEYGHQTDPPREGGVTPDEQAAYLEEALRVSDASGLVDMFIWFIYQDDPTADTVHWEAAGGLIDRDAQPKPSFERLQSTLTALRTG